MQVWSDEEGVEEAGAEAVFGVGEGVNISYKDAETGERINVPIEYVCPHGCKTSRWSWWSFMAGQVYIAALYLFGVWMRWWH